MVAALAMPMAVVSRRRAPAEWMVQQQFKTQQAKLSQRGSCSHHPSSQIHLPSSGSPVRARSSRAAPSDAAAGARDRCNAAFRSHATGTVQEPHVATSKKWFLCQKVRAQYLPVRCVRPLCGAGGAARGPMGARETFDSGSLTKHHSGGRCVVERQEVVGLCGKGRSGSLA